MRAAVALLLLVLPACDRVPENARHTTDGKRTLVALDRIDVTGDRARYTAEREGRTTVIDFAVPGDIIAPEVAHIGAPIGETSDGVVVFQDDYASRPSGERCRDGLESFVRVFSLPRRRQLMAEPLASCRHGLTAKTPSVIWLGNGRFRIEGAAAKTYRIHDDDRVEKES